MESGDEATSSVGDGVTSSVGDGATSSVGDGAEPVEDVNELMSAVSSNVEGGEVKEVKGECFVRIRNATTGRDLQVSKWLDAASTRGGLYIHQAVIGVFYFDYPRHVCSLSFSLVIEVALSLFVLSSLR